MFFASVLLTISSSLAKCTKKLNIKPNDNICSFYILSSHTTSSNNIESLLIFVYLKTVFRLEIIVFFDLYGDWKFSKSSKHDTFFYNCNIFPDKRNKNWQNLQILSFWSVFLSKFFYCIVFNILHSEFMISIVR